VLHDVLWLSIQPEWSNTRLFPTKSLRSFSPKRDTPYYAKNVKETAPNSRSDICQATYPAGELSPTNPIL
jgi:hypothetical protein